jgi:uncharacterized protein
MPALKTPGVYVQEISVFPPSVAEIDTAVPAFVGYTEKAQKTVPNDLILKPTKIYSFTEFEQYYGLPKLEALTATATKTADVYSATVAPPATPITFIFYHAIKAFFDNGGGKCYIVSVGSYAAAQGLKGDGGGNPATKFGLEDGLKAVANEDEPTLLVIPEAAYLNAADFGTLSVAMLKQCADLGDRFAILDVRDGGDVTGLDPTELTANRTHFGANNLKYGAAYYPFLKTATNYFVDSGETNVDVKVDGGAAVKLGTLKAPIPATPATPTSPATPEIPANTGAYNAVKAALREHYLTLPPSALVAGVYCAVDTLRGVWKAPANVGLAGVIEPVVKLDDERQGELNIDATGGKSINALRAFAGKGTLVWGARTLAGNDNEWRYVSVRRFFNTVEESVKKSTSWAVFEPNDANTWVKVRGMIENYLTQKWREGALAGATTKDAFFVRCGLGVTMNALDILEGRMHVEIGMAVVRPAEFIVLKFSHKLQTS